MRPQCERSSRRGFIERAANQRIQHALEACETIKSIRESCDNRSFHFRCGGPEPRKFQPIFGFLLAALKLLLSSASTRSSSCSTIRHLPPSHAEPHSIHPSLCSYQPIPREGESDRQESGEQRTSPTPLHSSAAHSPLLRRCLFPRGPRRRSTLILS